MKIRKATLKDLNLIVKINRESENEVDKLTNTKDSDIRMEIYYLMKNNKAEYFILGAKGFIAIKQDFAGYKNCELYYLMVSKKFQGKGVGTKLIKFIENYAKKKNFRAIYIYTHPIHKKAIRLYKKNNYKKINEFPDYYSNGDKSNLFSKKLK